jgi:hypothetical protein
MLRNNKNKVKILKAKGGADASKADFGTGVSARDANMGMAGKTGKPDPSLRGGTGGTSNTNVQQTNLTVKTGPVQVPTIGPLSYAFNKISKSLYDKKNLKDARKNDLLGGEMLTTGSQQTKSATLDRGENTQLCPDGTYPPCKTPATQSYDNGGEIVISSNVDKNLL